MSRKIFYIILFPVSLVFGLVTLIRNFLYDKGLLKSKTFDIPVISVGNLSVGGTGKTPHTEFLLSLISDDFCTAMLSRGYKRKTKGFYLADKKSDANVLGDEPYQIYKKFPGIIVAVDENRVEGIENLRRLYNNLGVIILDDAYQHRRVVPGFSILLTDYNHLYTRDFFLPSGRLRESAAGSRRADMVIVTKCPETITEAEMQAIKTELKLDDRQDLFFSSFEYQGLSPVFPESLITENKVGVAETSVLLVAGIVSPGAMENYLKSLFPEVSHLFFPDHHHFTKSDFDLLSKKIQAMNPHKSIIVVTEKDAARLLSDRNYPEELKSKTYALPIKVKILGGKEKVFTDKIKQYVEKNPGNR